LHRAARKPCRKTPNRQRATHTRKQKPHRNKRIPNTNQRNTRRRKQPINALKSITAGKQAVRLLNLKNKRGTKRNNNQRLHTEQNSKHKTGNCSTRSQHRNTPNKQ